jgi:hypothetical protein
MALQTNFGFGSPLRQLRNQHVKRVRDSAALVMRNVVIAAYRRPNQPFGGESSICNGISRVPILAWFCELAAAKRNDCGWQITGGMNLMKARGIL